MGERDLTRMNAGGGPPPTSAESPQVQRVLAQLESVSRSGDGFRARCPAHDDRAPSLSVNLGKDGRVLLHCHAGCEFKEVLKAMDLTADDLRSAKPRKGQRKASKSRWTRDQAERALQVRGLEAATIEAFGITIDLKKQAYRIPIGGGAKLRYFDPSEDSPKVKWEKKKPPDGDIFGLDSVPDETERVYLLEGELDVCIAWQAGLPAVTFTAGASRVPEAGVEALVSAGIVSVSIIYDADDPGREGAQKAASVLSEAGLDVEVRGWPEDVPLGYDVTDLYLGVGRDTERFLHELEALHYVPIDVSRRVVRITADLTEMTDRAEAALLSRPDLRIFVQGDRLVTVTRTGSSAATPWLVRAPRRLRVVHLTHQHMLAKVDAATLWYKAQQHGDVRKQPPGNVVDQLLARLRPPFPQLLGVLEAPTLRPDGSTLHQPGYDAATGLFLDPSASVGDWPDMPAEPTEEVIHAAVVSLLEPVQDFPFANESDRAAYLAAVLTVAGRHLVEGPTPLFAIRAVAPGTGKGLLASVIGLIGLGNPPAAMTHTNSSEEMRKRITVVAMEGTPLVLIDNVSRTLGSDTLAGALTATEWRDRILGQSAQVSLPLRTVWLCTGNNTTFSSTVARRVVPIDLDARMENPEDRHGFRHPRLVEHVRQRRGECFIAALTVLKGFIQAGRPTHGGPRMGSFEAWDDLVRSATMWATDIDPASALDVLSGRGRVRDQADLDRERTAELLETLARSFPDEEQFTAADVAGLASRKPLFHQDLSAAGLIGSGERVDAREIAYGLRGEADRPMGRFALRPIPGKRPRRYFVEVLRGRNDGYDRDDAF